jgi:exoribonuclease-2
VEIGTLVEFRHNNDKLLAVVQGTEGKKNLVLGAASGQTYSVHPRQIDYSLKAEGSPTSADRIPAFMRQVESLLDPEGLAVAWELLVEDRQPVAVVDIAQILFSQDSPVALYAAYRLLSEDSLYFKQKADLYEPRPAAQVQDLLHQKTIAEQRQREQADFEARLRSALQDRLAVEWTAAERLRLESLERLALHGEAATDREQGIQLLKLAGRDTHPDAAIALLVDLKLWSKHENIDLRQSGIPIRFSAELEAAAAHLMQEAPPDSTDRVDLTHLHTYTIDDASTRDIDDALSVEELAEGGERIWIHIADPSRWVSPDHPLELEARKRGTSVYLPEQVIPMFPRDLTTGPMSLVQGEVRCALSFGIRLNEDGSIAETLIQPSLIKVTYRLTYEDADEMLELGAERELTALAAAAQTRYQWRLGRGAISINLPEQDIKVIDEVPHLRVIEDTPARQLVAELMVLTGEAVASYARNHEIPFLYRFQMDPDLPPPDLLAQLPPGPVRDFALIRCMPRAEMTTTASGHAGLALDAYSQVTSPIRRYADLVAHRQLKAHLAGDPLPYSLDDLRRVITGLDPITYEAVQVERKRKRYWTLEFLKLQTQQVWRSLILGFLREHENLALVMLDEIAFRCPVRFERQIQPGEWVDLELLKVDPRTDGVEWREHSSQGAAVS